jgi:putative hydrolase of the HAD superfamily
VTATGPECVVFDLDDTLFLERDYVRSGLAAVARYVSETLGADGFFEHTWEAFEAGSRGHLFDDALVALGIEPRAELVRDLVAVYRSHPPSLTLLPDAGSCIARLQGRVAFAVVTDGPLSSQRAKAAAMQVDVWAAVTVFTAELGDNYGKPDPLAFKVVEEATGFSGRQCLYVADNPMKDFKAPNQLGWRTARVRRPKSLHYETPSGADVDREDPDLCWLGP